MTERHHGHVVPAREESRVSTETRSSHPVDLSGRVAIVTGGTKGIG